MNEQGTAWFALQVRARHEKAVEQALREKGYQMFLPLYRSRRCWSDRIKEIDLPLFPCYVFCRLDPIRLFPILTTPGVLRPVGFGNRPTPIDDSEVDAIQAIINSRLRYEPWPFFRIGQRVRIQHGCLQGVEGWIHRIKDRRRLVVSVTLLQRSCAVDIDQAWVTPMAAPPPRSTSLPIY